MKSMMIALALFLALPSFANTYKCAEKATEALAEGRLQYSVIVKELNQVVNPAVTKGWDHVYNVQVSILSRDPEAGGRFFLDRPTFSATARSEDVNYIITAKSKGFSLHIFLDEMDQASMTVKGVNGSIQLNCTSELHG